MQIGHVQRVPKNSSNIFLICKSQDLSGVENMPNFYRNLKISYGNKLSVSIKFLPFYEAVFDMLPLVFLLHPVLDFAITDEEETFSF